MNQVANQVVYRGLEAGNSSPIFGGFGAISASIMTDLVMIALTIGFSVIFFAIARRLVGAPNPNTISLSNETLMRGFYGILVALLLVSVLAFINPALVTGNIVFRTLSTEDTTSPSILFQPMPVVSKTTPTTVGASCVDPNVLLSQFSRGGGVCDNTVCSKTCTLDPSIMKIVKEEAVQYGLGTNGYQAIAALICRESGGNPLADSSKARGVKNTDGSVDCGLMQINNKSGTCDASIFDVKTNIDTGIKKYKNILTAVSSYSYTNYHITKDMMAFAAYNCCGNGDNPNSQSVSCTANSGFPYPIPKWACPIDPGPKPFNMCDVKAYACDVSTCSHYY